MDMLPDSQQYKDALARCDKLAKAVSGIVSGSDETLASVRLAFEMAYDLPAALATIAALQKRVEGLEILLGRVAENPDSCLSSPSLFWDVKEALKAPPTNAAKGVLPDNAELICI